MIDRDSPAGRLLVRMQFICFPFPLPFKVDERCLCLYIGRMRKVFGGREGRREKAFSEKAIRRKQFGKMEKERDNDTMIDG